MSNRTGTSLIKISLFVILACLVCSSVWARPDLSKLDPRNLPAETSPSKKVYSLIQLLTHNQTPNPSSPLYNLSIQVINDETFMTKDVCVTLLRHYEALKGVRTIDQKRSVEFAFQLLSIAYFLEHIKSQVVLANFEELPEGLKETPIELVSGRPMGSRCAPSVSISN